MQMVLDPSVHDNGHTLHEAKNKLPGRVKGPDVHTSKVKAQKLVLELDVGGALPHSLQRCPGNVKTNTMSTLVTRGLTLLLCQCLLMPLCR